MSITCCNDGSCICHSIPQEDLINFVKNHKMDILELLDFDNIVQKALDKQKKELTETIRQKEEEIRLREEKLQKKIAMTQSQSNTQSHRLMEKHKEEMRLIKEKLIKEQSEKDKLKTCLDLKERELNGSHSMYKGEYRELRQEIAAGNLYGKKYEVDGKKKMNCMDIRLISREHGYTVGIETKEKKALTANDIDKFHKDRINNRFYAGIMISTQAPIKGYVTEEHTYKITDNYLYIYSNDANMIGIAIGCFLDITENRYIKEQAACESTSEAYAKLEAKMNNSLEHCITMYKKWQQIQKANMDYDKQMIIGLVNMGAKEELFKNHRYVITRSKCKGKKHPYGLDK